MYIYKKNGHKFFIRGFEVTFDDSTCDHLLQVNQAQTM